MLKPTEEKKHPAQWPDKEQAELFLRAVANIRNTELHQSLLETIQTLAYGTDTSAPNMQQRLDS